MICWCSVDTRYCTDVSEDAEMSKMSRCYASLCLKWKEIPEKEHSQDEILHSWSKYHLLKWHSRSRRLEKCKYQPIGSRGHFPLRSSSSISLIFICNKQPFHFNEVSHTGFPFGEACPMASPNTFAHHLSSMLSSVPASQWALIKYLLNWLNIMNSQ